MPKGLKGEHHLADVICCVVQVARMATGETEDIFLKQLGKYSSRLAGNKTCAKSLTKFQRSEIAKKAA